MRRAAFSGGVVALVILSSALSASAQGFGAIGGTVLDEAGFVLPGVTVTLSNPGVIGGAQETVSDGRGAYQFPQLVPGTYTVTATLAGFSTRIQEGVVVNADVTARADLQLVVGALEETVTVTGETPLLDTSSTLRQTVMSREVIDTLPARQDIWAMARTAPAVVMTKYDVGGSEMFAQTASVVHGSAFEERTHMIDGMEVTWGGGEGWVISYFDAHSFEEVNFQTSGGSAEYGKGGPVINMITRTGTNDFRGEYSFTGGGGATAFDNLPARHFDDLLAAVPARALEANPNLVPSAKMLGVYDNSLTLGGPIVRDKLWYTFTSSLVYLRQNRLGSYNIDGTRVLESNRMRNVQTKFSWQAAEASQLHFMFNFNEKRVYFRPQNTGPSSHFIESNAMTSQRISSPLYQTKWTSVPRQNMLLEASASLLTGEEHGRPVPGVRPGDLPTFDAVRLEHRGGGPELPEPAGDPVTHSVRADLPGRGPRHQGRLPGPVAQARRHALLVHFAVRIQRRPERHSRGLSRRRARFRQHVQHADDLRDVRPGPRGVHSGQLAADAKADAEPGVAAGEALRLAARGLSAGNAVHRRGVLPCHQRRAGLLRAVSAVRPDLRLRRRRTDGAEVDRQPLQPADRCQLHPFLPEPGAQDERHPDVDRRERGHVPAAR